MQKAWATIVIACLSFASTVGAEQNSSLLDLSHKIDLLVEELQQLRAKVEEQEHRLQTIATVKVESKLEPASAPATSVLDPATPTLVPIETIAPKQTPELATPTPAVVVKEEAKPDTNEKASYDAAYALLQAREYGAAMQSFVALLEQYPQGALVPNASYWLGELYLLDNNYTAARRVFKRVVDDYPSHIKTPDSMLKLGYVEYEEGHFPDAFKILEDLKARFPSSPVARLAQARIDRMRQDGHI